MLMLNKENFEAEILQGSGLALVDYWSPKCEPCQELLPAIEALSEKYGDKLKFGKLDISQNRRLAIGQKVMGLPTIIIYKDGEKVMELSKEFTAEDVETKIKELI